MPEFDDLPIDNQIAVLLWCKRNGIEKKSEINKLMEALGAKKQVKDTAPSKKRTPSNTSRKAEHPGLKYKALRIERKLTQRQVADQSGVVYNTYVHVEQGRQKPTKSVEDKLDAFFGVINDDK